MLFSSHLFCTVNTLFNVRTLVQPSHDCIMSSFYWFCSNLENLTHKLGTNVFHVYNSVLNAVDFIDRRVLSRKSHI